MLFNGRIGSRIAKVMDGSDPEIGIDASINADVLIRKIPILTSILDVLNPKLNKYHPLLC